MVAGMEIETQTHFRGHNESRRTLIDLFDRSRLTQGTVERPILKENASLRVAASRIPGRNFCAALGALEAMLDMRVSRENS